MQLKLFQRTENRLQTPGVRLVRLSNANNIKQQNQLKLKSPSRKKESDGTNNADKWRTKHSPHVSL